MAEFIYQMIKARKAYGDRVILDDVTLSFLPGAKIGVVGPNGMGKSTLLKIMAGLDTVSNGEAYLTLVSPSAFYSRNRRWMTPRPSARTSRWHSARSPKK